jgi:hypothetical protein
MPGDDRPRAKPWPEAPWRAAHRRPKDVRPPQRFGVAGLCTRRNALENHGKAKQREDDVEWFDACFDVRHLVVTIEIFLQARYAERTPIKAANAAIPLWKRVPGKAAIGGIGERVSQCRQFPIEDRDYARLLRMEIRFPIRKSPWQIAV